MEFLNQIKAGILSPPQPFQYRTQPNIKFCITYKLNTVLTLCLSIEWHHNLKIVFNYSKTAICKLSPIYIWLHAIYAVYLYKARSSPKMVESCGRKVYSRKQIHNKYCDTSYTWELVCVYIGQLHGRCVALTLHNIMFITLNLHNIMFITLNLYIIMFITLNLYNIMFIILNLHNIMFITLNLHNIMFVKMNWQIILTFTLAAREPTDGNDRAFLPNNARRTWV